MRSPDDFDRSLRPRGKAEPRFDRDFVYGRQGELQINDYLKWIADGNERLETKRKSYVDAELYIETHHDPGRRGMFVPSGISTTAAHAWAFVVDDSGIAVVIPTDLLRQAISHSSARDRECTDGTCPTKGKLVNLNYLMLLERRRLERRAGT